MVVLLLVIGLGGSHRDATIFLELNDLLGGEVVEKGVGLVEVLVGCFGSDQLLLELFDLLEPFSESSIFIVVHTLLLFVLYLGQSPRSVCLQELGR